MLIWFLFLHSDYLDNLPPKFRSIAHKPSPYLSLRRHCHHLSLACSIGAGKNLGLAIGGKLRTRWFWGKGRAQFWKEQIKAQCHREESCKRKCEYFIVVCTSSILYTWHIYEIFLDFSAYNNNDIHLCLRFVKRNLSRLSSFCSSLQDLGA